MNIKEENDYLEQHEYLNINPLDDHLTHIKEHGDYYRRSYVSPLQAKRFLDHIKEYVNFYDKKVKYCNCCGNEVK